MTQSVSAVSVLGGTAVVVCGLLAAGGAVLSGLGVVVCLTNKNSVTGRTDNVLSILQDNSSWQKKACAVITLVGLIISAWMFKTTAMRLLGHALVLGTGAFALVGRTFGIAILSAIMAVAAQVFSPRY